MKIHSNFYILLVDHLILLRKDKLKVHKLYCVYRIVDQPYFM